jgi:hypothetical protein
MRDDAEIRSEVQRDRTSFRADDPDRLENSSGQSFVDFLVQLGKDALRFVGIGLVFVVALVVVLDATDQSDDEAAELAANVAEADRMAAQAEAEFEAPVADPRLMIHDRTEEHGSNILLDIDGSFVPLGRIDDAR